MSSKLNTYYKVHYTYHYSNGTYTECEHAPLTFKEAIDSYSIHYKMQGCSNVYVTKENTVDGTSIQVSAAALLREMR